MKQLFLYLFALGLLGALASMVEWTALAAAIASADLLVLLAACLLTALFPVLNMLRWQAVLLATGTNLPRKRLFAITMACWPIGTLTPAKAGEFLKGLAVPDRTKGVGAALAERVVDVAVLGCYGAAFGLLVGNPWAIAGGLFGLAAAGGVLVAGQLVLGFVPEGKLRTKLGALLSVLPTLAAHPRYLSACVLASALNWFLSMWQLQLVLLAFGESVPLELCVAILPAATFAGLLPLTPAGIGTRDFALLFLAAGAIPEATLLASSIVYTLAGHFLPSVAGLPFLWSIRHEER
jgi:hypothetical protein